MKHLPALVTALLPPDNHSPGHARWYLRPTHLASDSIKLSLYMRWAVLVLAPTLALLGSYGLPWISISLLVGLAYTALLTLALRAGRYPSLWLTVAMDVGLITSVIVFRGGLNTDIYLLYAIVLIYLGVAYSWRGAAVALGLTLLAYLPALWFVHGPLGIPIDPRANSLLFLRLVYLTLVAVGIGFVVTRYERAHRALDQAHAQLADRLRRLEAIQRISRRLHALTSVAAIGEAIAAETRDLIPYSNCRVHIWRAGPDGVTLPMIGFYGELTNQDAVPEGALDLRLGQGITGWVAEHGEAVLLDDATRDPRAGHIPGTLQVPYSIMAVPLRTETRVKGVIVMGRPDRAQFSPDDMQLLVILANSAAVALENAETQEVLAQQARTDPVTGLPHHGSFQIALALALAEAQQPGTPVALALLDLDGFRNYNERLGVQAGDACLERVGRLLQELTDDPALAAAPAAADAALPPLVSAYRTGGDEFALLLRGALAQEEDTLALAQRAVDAVARLFGDDPLARITASAGLAWYPTDAAHRTALVDLADAALYLVRQTGGNRLGRADALARETLVLRGNLDKLVQTSLAGAGSESVVEYLVTETATLQQSLHHSTLADRLTTEALRALAAAIDAKDDYTRGHSERVAAIAGEIARHLGCGSQEVQRIITAARMHDIGKIGVPDDVLHKGRDLTTDEKATVARHPEVGAAILMPIHTLRDVVPIVRHHHERVDGQGYPSGLRGAAIPCGARVLAVADALDAMITDRPYRRGMAIEAALAELQRHVGTHFWQPVVAAAVALYGPGGGGLAVRNTPRLEVALTPGVPAGRPDGLSADLRGPLREPKAVAASSHPG